MIGTPPQIVDLRPKEAYLGREGPHPGRREHPVSRSSRNASMSWTPAIPDPSCWWTRATSCRTRCMPLLEERGHRWIYVLKGGFKAWRRAKYPVYSTPGEPRKEVSPLTGA